MKILVEKIKEEVKSQMGYENAAVNSVLVVTITQKKRYEVTSENEANENDIDITGCLFFIYEGTTYYFVKQ
jgi:hypothetical protein